MRKVKKLVLVIQEVKTKEVLERWQFDIETDEEIGKGEVKNADERRIRQEMSDVLR